MSLRAVFLLLLLGAPGAAQAPLPRYRLAVHLEPVAHLLSVTGWIGGLPCGPAKGWYLNRWFTVDTLASGSVPFDTAAAPPPYVSVARPLRACVGDSARVVYHGTLADTIDDINTIAPGLVELASYAAWYPFNPAAQRFTYELTVTLPAGTSLVTNGRMLGDATVGNMRTVQVRSDGPTSDIVLVSADLATERRAVGSLAVEMYAPPDEKDGLGRDASALAGALSAYRRWYGPVSGAGVARFVYSPRGGWGYSRLPLVVVSDGYHRKLLARPGGEARSFEGNAHELAHFWWSLADPLTPDDWLNEGLAEYTAFSETAERFGVAARDSLLAGYRRDVARAGLHVSIAATTADSPDRYVNRYEKVTLLLLSVEQMVGPASMRTFLRRFYRDNPGSRGATTAGFVAAGRRYLGAAAGALLEACLASEWTARCGGARAETP